MSCQEPRVRVYIGEPQSGRKGATLGVRGLDMAVHFCPSGPAQAADPWTMSLLCADLLCLCYMWIEKLSAIVSCYAAFGSIPAFYPYRICPHEVSPVLPPSLRQSPCRGGFRANVSAE